MGTNESESQVVTNFETDDIERYFNDVQASLDEITVDLYRNALRDFEAYAADSVQNDTGEPVELQDVTDTICERWLQARDEGDLKKNTILTRANVVKKFYSHMMQHGTYTRNPILNPLDEYREEIPPAERRDMGIVDMRRFLNDIDHPADRAALFTLLKTGINVGELCNLDCRDVTLSGETYGPPAITMKERPELDPYTDAIYVSPNIEKGVETNGEVRDETNSREYPTVIPVDEELKQVLKQWLLVRPTATSEAEPLFVSTTQNWGQRLTSMMVRNIVTTHAKDADVYIKGGGVEKNVTPSYLRDYLVTHFHNEQTDLGFIMYLKGISFPLQIRKIGPNPDIYSQNWETRVRDVYEENVYSLFPNT